MSEKQEKVQQSQAATLGAMACNFVVSCTIIWANKFVYMGGFKNNVCMTALHFFVTFLGLEICARFGAFERKWVPVRKVLPIATAFCGFVVFNNFSLQYNLVGVYQLWKVMTTPAIVVIQSVFYGMQLPLREKVTLIPICIGVVCATAGEFRTNVTGTVFALLGLFSTSFYQIMVKTEQQALQLDAWQLLYLQAPLSCVMLLLIAPVCEDVGALASGSYTTSTWFWLGVTAVLAFLVNLSIFIVIRRTSPLSYNVLGHGKLCTILLSGFLFFGEEPTSVRLLGISLALFGIFAYTYVKLNPVSKK